MVGVAALLILLILMDTRFLIFFIIALCAGEAIGSGEKAIRPGSFGNRRIKDSLNILVAEQSKKNCFQIGILADYYGGIRHAGENPFFLTQGLQLGVESDYRKNIFRFLGFRIGNRLAAGLPEFSIFRDSSVEKNQSHSTFEYESKGKAGWLFSTTPYFVLTLGPFGRRVSLEPGMGLTWGWVTTESVQLEGSAGAYAYSPPKHFFYINGRFSVSLIFGVENRFNLLLGGQFGMNPNNSVQFQLGPTLTYSFFN